jgi:hypothetical protein
VWLEGLGQFRNPMMSSDFEPVTFRILAYFLNLTARLIVMAWCSNKEMADITVMRLFYMGV